MTGPTPKTSVTVVRPAARAPPGRLGHLQAQIQLSLPSGQPLPRNRLQKLQPGAVMRRPDVLDLPRPAMVGAHNLNRRRARRRPHRPHIRHPATLEPPASAQNQSPQGANQQVSETI